MLLRGRETGVVGLFDHLCHRRRSVSGQWGGESESKNKSDGFHGPNSSLRDFPQHLLR